MLHHHFLDIVALGLKHCFGAVDRHPEQLDGTPAEYAKKPHRVRRQILLGRFSDLESCHLLHAGLAGYRCGLLRCTSVYKPQQKRIVTLVLS
jgi:hypothetical protein